MEIKNAQKAPILCTNRGCVCQYNLFQAAGQRKNRGNAPKRLPGEKGRASVAAALPIRMG